MKWDIDITGGKVIETDGDTTLSVHFMNCSIAYTLVFPQQGDRDIPKMLW